MSTLLPKSLLEAIRADVAVVSEEEIKAAQQRVEKRVCARIAQIAATVVEKISIETMKDNIVITLNFDGVKRD